jgi:hypothetical protein
MLLPPGLHIKPKDFAIPLRESLVILAFDEDSTDAGDVTRLLSHCVSLTSERKRDRHPEVGKLLEHDPSPCSPQIGESAD